MRRTRRLTVGLLIALAGSVGIAHASSTNVITAIKAQDSAIRKLPANKELDAHLVKSTSVTEAKRLVALIGPLKVRTDHAISIVAHSTTTSAAQRKGRAEWVAASHQQLNGISEYRSALRELIAGDRSAFKAVNARARKLIVESLNASAKADKLLGISINY